MFRKKNSILFLFLLWIFISLLSVLYNATNTISEIKNWGFLSENQKKEKIFGGSYEFSEFIKQNSERNAHILFFSTDGMPFFYARYNTYPRRLYWYQNADTYVKSTYPKQFDYIAFYNMKPIVYTNELVSYELIATFSAKQQTASGSLYKRK